MPKILTKVYRGALSLDTFSKEIGLKYQKQKTYRTIVGTLTSIMIFIIWGYFGMRQFIGMINRERFSTNIGVKPLNYVEEPLNMTFRDEEIYISFSWYFQEKDLFEGAYGTLKLWKFSTSFNPESRKYINNNEVTDELVRWTEEMFSREKYLKTIKSPENHNSLLYENLYWFKRDDFYRMFLHGDPSKNEISPVITLNTWVSPLWPIDSSFRLGNSLLTIHYISKNYDIADSINPVKYRYDDFTKIKMSAIGTAYANLMVKRNDYRTNDWYSFFSEGKTESFYSIQETFGSHQVTNDNFTLIIEFGAMGEINDYETNIIGIIDILGIIGGFYEILHLTWSIFVQRIADFFFKRNLMKKLIFKKKEKEWFSYPSSIPNSRKENKKSNKISNEKKEIELEESKSNF